MQLVYLLLHAATAAPLPRRAFLLAGTGLVTGYSPAVQHATAVTEVAALSPVADLAGVLERSEAERLERILRSLEADTGYKVRVVTQARGGGRDSEALADLKRGWRIGGSSAAVDPNAILVIADRGISGSLEAGSPYLRYDVGANVQLVLPGVFWGRLQREYGKLSFVERRGEAAAVVVSCELILTCLRNEDFCITVPPASSSYF
jgi:hypothetical protein